MDAVVAVIGTLAGAIIGAGGTWLIERERRRHERQTRWLTERRTIYASVLRTADAYIDAVHGWARRHNWGEEGSFPKDMIGPWPNDEAFEAAYFEAELLAPWPVLLPLEHIRNSVLEVVEFREAAREGPIAELRVDELHSEYRGRRAFYLKKVREDLDVPDYPKRPRGRVSRIRGRLRRWREKLLA